MPVPAFEDRWTPGGESLTPWRRAAYHRAVLPKLASFFPLRLRSILSVAVLLALAACATAPAPTTRSASSTQPAQSGASFIPSPEDYPGEMPWFIAESGPQASELDALALRATGGDPDSVTNATLQLRSEYGDLWMRIRGGFELADLDAPLVTKSEDWYEARPAYVARMIERSRRYLYYIVVEVEKRNMPLEIALLPMIESAYNPMAYSRSRASGIWQFIPSTGKLYGLKQNWWLDERRDVLAATNGALDYLQKLHAEFGDWYLALAAYNCGEGTIRRAIAANQKRGKPIDYLSLKLPAETREYVPKLQAVKNIVRDPGHYDLVLADMPDAPYFTVVHTSRKMDVKVAAELAEMPLDEFLSLNPQHNRPVIAGADEATILLPYDRAELFAAKLELTNQPMVTWQAYKIRANESLAQVAARFGLPLETLRTINGIGPRAKVPVGHALLVPSQAPSDATVASLQNTAFTTVPSGRSFYHRVRKGETLMSIAARYEVTPQDLKSWNKTSGASLVAGQRLRVVSDVSPAAGKKSTRSRHARTAKATTSAKSSNHPTSPSSRPSPKASTKP
jgi:membrane-bound lytic murein transglycosylase D